MNIPLIKPDLPDFQEVGSDFRKILKSGKITNFGDYLKRFEQEVSSYLGTYVAAVSSGTIGLILTLQALGVKPGERIIIPSFTFMATAQAVLYAGALPLFADVDERQKALASELAAKEAEKQGFQYICTMNSDSVPYSSFSSAFDFGRYVRVRLTDKTEDGGLFGIRF